MTILVRFRARCSYTRAETRIIVKCEHIRSTSQQPDVKYSRCAAQGFGLRYKWNLRFASIKSYRIKGIVICGT